MGDVAQVQAWLADIWSPAVMVLESPEVTKECVESCGLTAAELLRPFGVLPELNGSVGGRSAWVARGGEGARRLSALTRERWTGSWPVPCTAADVWCCLPWRLPLLGRHPPRLDLARLAP